MIFSKWFRRSATKEEAQQNTVFERRALELPGPVQGALPASVYDQMERDAMVQTALTVKKLGVLASRWKIVPADSSPAAAAQAQFVEEAFRRMEGSPNDILSAGMDAFSKGWSVQELVFEQDGDRLWLAAVRPKDPQHFGLKVDGFGRLHHLILQIPGEVSRELPTGKFIIYRNRDGYGRAKGRSDLDAAYPHWKAKQGLLDAWNLYLKRFASPTVLSKVGSTVPSADREKIARSLEGLESSMSLVFPADVDVTTLGGDRDASNGFEDAIDFHNREIARSILGQTLTTDEGRRVGSLAMGKVHLQVLLLQLESIRKELADRVMTEQVIRPLCELNFGPGHTPRFEFAQANLEAFITGTL